MNYQEQAITPAQSFPDTKAPYKGFSTLPEALESLSTEIRNLQILVDEVQGRLAPILSDLALLSPAKDPDARPANCEAVDTTFLMAERVGVVNCRLRGIIDRLAL